MASGEQFWVKDLGKDLEALDDAGAGAVEIVIAIGDDDAGLAHGLQVAPARAMRKQRHVLEAVGDIKAARMHDDDVWISGNERVPLEPGRMLTRLSEQVVTSGHLHQLRHPVSAGHQRIDPLDRGDARPIARRRAHLGDGLHARPQLSHDALALAFAPERACHLPDVLPDVGKPVGPERHDLGGTTRPVAQSQLDVLEADRTGLAMILRHDDVGPKRPELLSVDAIDRKTFLQNRLHALVYLIARAVHWEFRRGEHWQQYYILGEVAFLAAADETVASAQRADDLRCARDQRHHALGLVIYHRHQC